MAPIHHHYEKKGWPEPKIIVRFWIISILLALVAPRDPEAPVTQHVGRQYARVIVVGLGTSGVAACPAPRRARRPRRRDGSRSGPRATSPRLRRARSAEAATRARRHVDPRRARGADSIVVSPGVPLRGARAAGRAASHGATWSSSATSSSSREAGAPRRRHRRHERQEHDDDARRRARSSARAVARSSAETSASRARPPRRPARRDVVLEVSSFQLERRTRSQLEAAAAERHARPPRPLPDLADYAEAKARIFERAATADREPRRRDRRARCLGQASVASASACAAATPISAAHAGEAGMARRGRRSALSGRRAPASRGGTTRERARRACGRKRLRLPARGDDGGPARASAAAAPHGARPRLARRRLYDDSKGTNVGATVAAIAGLDGPLVLIAGGATRARTTRRSSPRARARSGTPSSSADAPTHRRRSRGELPVSIADSMEQPSASRRRSPGRATRCSSRPPARASTCSVTTPSAARPLPQPCGGLPQ